MANPNNKNEKIGLLFGKMEEMHSDIRDIKTKLNETCERSLLTENNFNNHLQDHDRNTLKYGAGAGGFMGGFVGGFVYVVMIVAEKLKFIP